MTPVFCCGFECGVTVGAHFQFNSPAAFSTSIVRSGARSARFNTTAGTAFLSGTNNIISAMNSATQVIRFYIRFETLPSADTYIYQTGVSPSFLGIAFKNSDSKLYTASGASPTTFGSTGISVTTQTWYRIDLFFLSIANPWTIDAKVDGVSLSQLTLAAAAVTPTFFNLGIATTCTADMYLDDFIISQTSGDYPIGEGYINNYIPTSDGSHNVAGANDFERSATGTDITNATTDAFQLINDVPLKSGVVSEYINLVAPPNATDYVEVIFGPAPNILTPTYPPRAVEAIVAYASASAGTNNLRIALNDNGSLDDVLNTNTGPGTTATYARKHYIDPPSAATAWTLSGNGNFNNVRMRCFTSDAAPDPWWASAMIEAEFAEWPQKIVNIKQAVNRASTY